VNFEVLGVAMEFSRIFKQAMVGVLILTLAACGGNGFKLLGPPNSGAATELEARAANPKNIGNPLEEGDGTSIFDLFRQRDDGTKVGVNRYLWNASLDVLEFLPVQSVDPFSGVIITGYGTPPGGGQSYRATVYISDPALEARSLKVAMQTRGNRPVSASTQRAVEDAILTRARQLRVRDKKF
jgi:hypothetical protein